MTRRTKIVATIGPASERREDLVALLAAGVDVCRLNLSHGSLDDHIRRVAMCRDVADELGRPLAVLADLPGPKIRAGMFPDSGVELGVGTVVELVPGDGDSDGRRICVDYDRLLADLAAGDRVVIGDGAIAMRVTSVDHATAAAEVIAGGSAQGRPGVHLAGEGLAVGAPTDDDLALADEMADRDVDYIALSFVRSGEDVATLRGVVGSRAKIMAKIETASALAELADIVEESDAVMVARGDLGIDCPLEDVPHLQKEIIRHCVEAGTPVVTATQMLESMIVAPSPTRAEVSDVANAVFDGTDAVMLSGETAIGANPPLVVRTMARIAARAEAEASYRRWGARLGRIRRVRPPADERLVLSDRITESITHAAWQAADDVDAAAIICCTGSGRLARTMARFRPVATLLGMSPDPRVRSNLALSWGVVPLATEKSETTDGMVWEAVGTAREGGFVRSGDTVVVIAGAPDRTSEAAADVMRIVSVP